MKIKLPLDNATDDQIRDFAETMQVDTSDAKDRAGLIALLGLVWDQPHISVDMPADEDALVQDQGVDMPVREEMAGGIGENDPKVRLVISKTPMPGGNDPVPVGHNGRTVVIQRDVEVNLPYRFYLALLDAKREDVVQDDRSREIFATAYTNYPINVLALPGAEEIAAWRARTDAQFAPA